MRDDEVKVGEELIDIAQRIDDSKNMVDEAMQIFQSTMSEFISEYLGTADDDNNIYAEYYTRNLNILSEMYEKTKSYVLYTFKQMNFTDEEISGMIQKSQGVEV